MGPAKLHRLPHSVHTDGDVTSLQTVSVPQRTVKPKAWEILNERRAKSPSEPTLRLSHASPNGKHRSSGVTATHGQI